jgi:predicted membrane-bound mannosyltransferase
MEFVKERTYGWLDHPLLRYVTLNAETIIWVAVFLLALFTRFYELEPRVMSHDENSHVYYLRRL